MLKTVADLKELFAENNQDKYSLESYEVILDDILGVNDEIDTALVSIDKVCNHYAEFNSLKDAFFYFEDKYEYERLVKRVKEYFKGEDYSLFDEIDEAIKEYFDYNDINYWVLNNHKVLTYSK